MSNREANSRVSSSQDQRDQEASNVIELNRVKKFTLEEVDQLLPIVRKITAEYAGQVQSLMARLDALKNRGEEETNEVEDKINSIVEIWQTKMEKLGAHTKGLWIADFDSGDGYFCWKFPEDRIRYWHKYSDGFRGRVLVGQRVDENVQVSEVSKSPSIEI